MRLCAVDVYVEEKWPVHMKFEGKSYKHDFFKMSTENCGEFPFVFRRIIPHLQE